MNIQTFEGGFDNNLSYLVWCSVTKIAALIDASVFPDPIIRVIDENDLTLEKIILTHSHGDHTAYCRQFIERFPDVIIFGHEKFLNSVSHGNFTGVRHRSVIKLGKSRFVVLHTPGHYPDGICLWDEHEKSVFTGDTVFVGRTGRTVDSKSDLAQLYHSVYHVVQDLPEDTIVYPGHHYGSRRTTTIGENIRTSPFFNCKNFREFSAVMDKFEKNRRNNIG